MNITTIAIGIIALIPIALIIYKFTFYPKIKRKRKINRINKALKKAGQNQINGEIKDDFDDLMNAVNDLHYNKTKDSG